MKMNLKHSRFFILFFIYILAIPTTIDNIVVITSRMLSLFAKRIHSLTDTYRHDNIAKQSDNSAQPTVGVFFSGG